MNEVSKTLFIPLYGKALVSRKGIILDDKKAEEIWAKESFEMRGKSKSKWLAYNISMRARVFDDWANQMLRASDQNTIIIQIGCGLDSRCLRVREQYYNWIDCDFPDVINVRRKYYEETEHYKMVGVDASNIHDLASLPNAKRAVVLIEGVSMYLMREKLIALLAFIKEKYSQVHILMDVYTALGAKTSKYKHPVNDVGVQSLNGVDDMNELLAGTRLRIIKEHSFTPKYLVDELKGFEKAFFKLMFTGKMYSRFYRLYELG